jgi:hypothetical protein
VFTWRLQNDDPRRECSQRCEAASTYTGQSTVQLRVRAEVVLGGLIEVQLVAPEATRADRSRYATGRGVDAVDGTDPSEARETPQMGAVAKFRARIVHIQYNWSVVMKVRMSLICIFAACVSASVFTWRLQNDEPRRQCSQRCEAASTYTGQSTVQLRVRAEVVLGGLS